MSGAELSDFDRMFDCVMSNIDLIDRLEGMIFVWRTGNWRKEYRKHGVAGLVKVFVSCLTAHNVVWMEVSRYGIRGIDIERMLRTHGVKLGDRSVGPDGHTLTFNVKRRQAKWCEYLLHRYGATVLSAPREPRNAAWAARHKVRDMPAEHSKWRVKR